MESVAEFPPVGVAHLAAQAEDALDEPPKPDEPAARPRGHRERQAAARRAEQQHQDANARIAEIETVDAEPAQEDAQ